MNKSTCASFSFLRLYVTVSEPAHLDMFPALLKSLSQHGDYVLVVVKEVAEHLRKPLFILQGLNLWKVVQGLKRLYVELVDRQDGGVAADDEGQGPDLGDAVGQADGKFFPQVLCAFLDGTHHAVRDVSFWPRCPCSHTTMKSVPAVPAPVYMIVDGVR